MVFRSADAGQKQVGAAVSQWFVAGLHQEAVMMMVSSSARETPDRPVVCGSRPPGGAHRRHTQATRRRTQLGQFRRILLGFPTHCIASTHVSNRVNDVKFGVFALTCHEESHLV